MKQEHVVEAYPFAGTRIKPEDEKDARYWCKFFKCTLYDLRKAIMHVGTSVPAVEAFLVMNQMTRYEEQEPVG